MEKRLRRHVKNISPLWLYAKDDLYRKQVPTGSVGIVDEVHTTSDNITVYYVIFDDGIVAVNPTMLEDYNENDIETSPGLTKWDPGL